MATFLYQINWAPKFYAVGTLTVGIAFLYFLQPLLAPVVIAALLTLILAPSVSWLEYRWRIRRPLAVLAIVCVMALTIVALGAVVLRQVATTVDAASSYESRLRDRIESLSYGTQALTRLEDAVDRIRNSLRQLQARAGSRFKEPVESRVTVISEDPTVSPWSAIKAAALPLLSSIATAAFSALLLIFFLLDRERLRDTMLRVVGDRQIAATTTALNDAAALISSYLLRQFCINAVNGVVTAACLAVLGLPQALTLGIIAGALRYVPYLGPWISGALILVAATIFLPSWAAILIVLAFLVLSELVINLVVEPKLLGQGTGISPSALVIMLAFWTLIWGPVGLLVGTPLTVCLYVIGRHVPGLELFTVVLGDRPALPAFLSLYQRLVSGRLGEALVLLRSSGKTFAIQADSILIPALVRAQEDVRTRALLDQDAATFWGTVDSLLEESRAGVGGSEFSADTSQVCVVTGSRPGSQALGGVLANACEEAGIPAVHYALATPGEAVRLEIPSSGVTLVVLIAYGDDLVMQAQKVASVLTRRFPSQRIMRLTWQFQDGEGSEAQGEYKGNSHHTPSVSAFVQTIRAELDTQKGALVSASLSNHDANPPLKPTQTNLTQASDGSI